jgi:DNA-binding response OmpR family regulator
MYVKTKEKKIMIADDDPDIVDFISIMLQMEGYQVSSTLNGTTLLNMDGELPDLVLMDICMSGTDGREICRQLKKKEYTSKIPVLLLSASTDIEPSAIYAGADDFISKPFEMVQLLNKVKQYVSDRN